ncbi:hypothetical protein ACF08P_41005 [Streptomyces olivaceoviridis]|uniref:hypothetical protein n=1 Tax=Streptomyces olivaceoviridis TaxID=1921 RepID=UPI0036F5024B
MAELEALAARVRFDLESAGFTPVPPDPSVHPWSSQPWAASSLAGSASNCVHCCRPDADAQVPGDHRARLALGDPLRRLEL